MSLLTEIRQGLADLHEIRRIVEAASRPISFKAATDPTPSETAAKDRYYRRVERAADERAKPVRSSALGLHR